MERTKYFIKAHLATVDEGSEQQVFYLQCTEVKLDIKYIQLLYKKSLYFYPFYCSYVYTSCELCGAMVDQNEENMPNNLIASLLRIIHYILLLHYTKKG